VSACSSSSRFNTHCDDWAESSGRLHCGLCQLPHCCTLRPAATSIKLYTSNNLPKKNPHMFNADESQICLQHFHTVALWFFRVTVSK